MSQQMPSDDVQALIDRLKGDGDLRVWSVIVTIMGDMARAPGESISGATLSELMDAMGIRPEAARVALHRLRKDGWITSQRVGRGSNHALTDYGREQTLAVVDKVYGRDMREPARWNLIVTNPHASNDPNPTLIQNGFTAISTGVFLGTTHVEPNDDYISFSTSTDRLPDWMITKILNSELHKDITELLSILRSAPSELSCTTALKKATVRLLVLHRWRRIALRLPKLPFGMLAPVRELHTLVHQLLDRCRTATNNSF